MVEGLLIACAKIPQPDRAQLHLAYATGSVRSLALAYATGSVWVPFCRRTGAIE